MLKILEEENPCAYGVIVIEFLAKKAMFQDVYLCHEHRECNVEAQILLKVVASSESGRHVWLT